LILITLADIIIDIIFIIILLLACLLIFIIDIDADYISWYY
jgi:hypothetical protein